jgi:cellulose synthase (UDP-forming)
MNAKIASLILIMLLSWISVVSPVNAKNKPQVIGIYDPAENYLNENRLALQSLFFTWDEKPAVVQAALAKVLANKRIPALTIEPWYTPALGQTNLLTDITAGKYDATINQLCNNLASFRQPIWIRWGHEMELTNSRYPWSNAKPSDYIAAYQYFVGQCQTHSRQFSFIWSPAGEIGLENYWPGAGYVDYIGLSVYSFDQWEIQNIGRQRSFAEILKNKYDRVVKFNKPIAVSEMGVTGSHETKSKWIKAAAESLGKFPKVTSLTYFNSKDLEGVWGYNLSTPDWRITPQNFAPLLKIARVTNR